MDIKELAPALAHRTCNRYKHGDEWPYQFTEQGVIDFATRLIAAYLAEQEEVVRVVDGGGELHLPKLQWVSANHSLETPIGSKLFTAPPLPAIPDERIAILEQQVAALTKERNALQDKLNAVVTVGIREREQLVAAQAREAKLQGKLFHFGRHHSNCGWQMNRPCNCGFDEALALPVDDSALIERLKQERERVWEVVDRELEGMSNNATRDAVQDAIRGLA